MPIERNAQKLAFTSELGHASLAFAALYRPQ
jgi:hypothetical protein